MIKKTIFSFAMLLFSTLLYAQTNEGFNYKAIVSNNGNPVTNGQVAIKFELRNATGTLVWSETHSNVPTDANAICSITMGEGTRTGGSATNFQDINWGESGLKYRVIIDAGSGFNVVVNDETFKYVPYAKSSEKITGIQNRIRIGGNTTWNEALHVENNLSLPFTYDVAYFKAENPGTDDAVLDLFMPAGDSFYYIWSDKFRVNSNGDIVKSRNIEVEGKLTAPDSGDADMKAYAYGEWYSGLPRHTTPNVTITKISTGHYKVTFSNSFSSTDDYIVIGNKYAHIGFVEFSKASSFFYVKTFNISGNLHNSNFTFVVYKK